MSEYKKLLVVFDIDETLIHFIPHKYFPIWEKQKKYFNEDMYLEQTNEAGKKVCVIFRPHLKEMLDLFKTDTFFKAALWTYSEKSYCEWIAKVLTEKYDLPEDFFLFKKGAEDIDEDVGIPKNLEVVYEEFPEYNKFNTILVDDRYSNINNESNKENGLVIQPFAPFGPEKVRVKLSVKNFTIQLKDNVFLHILDILNIIKHDIQNCEDDDVRVALTKEPVFLEKRINRMKLAEYYQTFAVKFKKVASVGVPYLSKNFIMIPDYEKYTVGGKRKRTKKRKMNKKKTTIKTRVHAS